MVLMGCGMIVWGCVSVHCVVILIGGGRHCFLVHFLCSIQSSKLRTPYSELLRYFTDSLFFLIVFVLEGKFPHLSITAINITIVVLFILLCPLIILYNFSKSRYSRISSLLASAQISCVSISLSLPTKATMARRYDSSTTTFSPEGRLHQVEYAIEAINNAGTSVGILAKDGVVMASERKITSGLLAPAKVSETLPLFSLLVYCVVLG